MCEWVGGWVGVCAHVVCVGGYARVCVYTYRLGLSPKKGTLVMIHGHTWHRVLPIKESRRVSTNFRAIPKGTPEDITDICIYRNMRYQFSTERVIEERK